MKRIDGVRYANPGTDLPAWFLDSLRAIDPNFIVIFHPFRIIYDDLMNFYTGKLDDPRFSIHWEGGQRVFGFILTDRHKNPIPENKFHIWHYRWPAGYTHVIRIDSKNEFYLETILETLHRQALLTDKHSRRARTAMLKAEQEQAHEKAFEAESENFKEVMLENKQLLRVIRENLERGLVLPTNPTKDVITSYPGQSNRSRIVRPLEDREGGLYVPEN